MRERIPTLLNPLLKLWVVLAAIVLLGVMATASGAAEGDTTLVSVNGSGNQANSSSRTPSISSDGRFVAFASQSTNLTANDTNDADDIFVHDRQTGTTQRVSVSSSGNQGKRRSYAPAISSDGRFVAFVSRSANLVPSDTNGSYDIFVHDRQTGTTERVSVNSAGEQADRNSFIPSISPEGRFVAFYSLARNLVPNDTNGYVDVFVHDRQTDTTQRVSVSSSGEQGEYTSYNPSISSGGRFVAFESMAWNLVPNDSEEPDIFVHERESTASSSS